MIFKFNNYTSIAGEVRIVEASRNEVLNARGAVDHIAGTLRIEGYRKLTTEALITAWVNDVNTRFVRANSDAALYHADGSTLSGHYLANNYARNGIHVNLTWLDKPGEYATGRTYSATFTAELDGLTSGYTSFRETIQLIGTGGVRIAYSEPIIGAPLRQQVNAQTITHAIQSGSATGYTQPSAPSPIWSTFEDVDKRRIATIGAQRVGGILRDYGIQWSYQFTGASAFTGTPSSL